MNKILDSYVETSFDGNNQAEYKIHQFRINYKIFFPNPDSAIVLDIGIGRGEMLTCMKNWGFNYEGVDISQSTVNLCMSFGLRCELTNDTVSWLKSHQNKYSLITCLDVLEHIPKNSTIEFIVAIREALIEGGKAIIQVPNLQSPYGYLHHFNDFTHECGFVEHSLTQVILAAGFTKFKFGGFEEIYQKNIKSYIRKGLRYFYWKLVRFMRAINMNPNPIILNPVLYVVLHK